MAITDLQTIFKYQYTLTIRIPSSSMEDFQKVSWQMKTSKGPSGRRLGIEDSRRLYKTSGKYIGQRKPRCRRFLEDHIAMGELQRFSCIQRTSHWSSCYRRPFDYLRNQEDLQEPFGCLLSVKNLKKVVAVLLHIEDLPLVFWLQTTSRKPSGSRRPLEAFWLSSDCGELLEGRRTPSDHRNSFEDLQEVSCYRRTFR